MVQSFEPIIDDKCKVLILGTMPSQDSLKYQQYYGNKQNKFWDIIFALFDAQKDDDYEARKAFLLDHHIAIWDVLYSCDREGSMDNKIRNPETNDVNALLQRYSNIKAIYFNGAAAEPLFKKLINKPPDIIMQRLPSTSPANAIKFEEKLKEWQVVKNGILR